MLEKVSFFPRHHMMEHLFLQYFVCSSVPPHTLFILSVLVLDGQILESFNCGTFFRFDLKQRWNILRSLEQILNPLYSLF